MDLSGLPTFRFAHPTSENLPRLARLAYEASSAHCGDCRNYHVMAPYLRQLGIGGIGPEFAFDVQIEALLRVAAGRGAIRWLLAGSADAGLLGLVGEVSSRLPGTTHEVTIVDRCETPLVLCRDHAAATGLALTTIRSDLRAYDAPGSADIVLMHFTTIFVPEAERAAFVRHAGSWLAPGGRLVAGILYDRAAGGPALGPSPNVRTWREAVIRSDAAIGSFDPPEDIDVFVGRIDQRGILRSRQRQTLEEGLELVRMAGLSPLEAVLLPFAHDEAAIWGKDTRQRAFVIASGEELIW